MAMMRHTITKMKAVSLRAKTLCGVRNMARWFCSLGGGGGVGNSSGMARTGVGFVRVLSGDRRVARAD